MKGALGAAGAPRPGTTHNSRDTDPKERERDSTRDRDRDRERDRDASRFLPGCPGAAFHEGWDALSSGCAGPRWQAVLGDDAARKPPVLQARAAMLRDVRGQERPQPPRAAGSSW